MKKLLLPALSLALPLAAVGQTTPGKSYFGINAGASYATGNFRATDPSNLESGFAKTGFHVALDGAHFFGNGPLGLAGQLAFSDNGRLLSSDLQQLGAAYTEAFDVDYSTVSASGRYRRLTALVGPTVMFGPSTFKVELRGLVGVQQLLGTPEVTVELEDDPSTTFVQRSSHSLTFGYAAGLGLHYYLTPRLGLVARGEFQGSSPATIHNDNRGTSTGRLSEKQPVTAFNSTLGLAFRFGN